MNWPAAYHRFLGKLLMWVISLRLVHSGHLLKKKKGIIFIYTRASSICEAQAWQTPIAEFTQISLSRSAESWAFSVNWELMLSDNVFWTVFCTVNSQRWNSYLCLRRVTTKGKLSNYGYHTVTGIYQGWWAVLFRFILRLFSSSWSAAWKTRCKRIIHCVLLCSLKEMISQQKGPSPTFQPVQKMTVNIANDICQKFLSLLVKEQLRISGTSKLEEIISSFTSLMEAILFWHDILMAEVSIKSHCQEWCQCLLYGRNQETLTPDFTNVPGGPQVMLAKGPAEKPVLVTSRNVSATRDVQF